MGAKQAHERKMRQLYPMGLKFRQYEADLAKNRQDLKEPKEKNYKITKYVVGVSEHKEEIAFQIIFNDKSRTQANCSELNPEGWSDHYITGSTNINRAEVMYDKNDMLLLGIRFHDKLGNVLLETSWMKDPRYKKRDDYSHLGFKNIPLGETERFVGVRADTRNKKIAQLYDFQFVIARKPTEEETRPPKPKPSCWQIIKKKLD